MKSTSKISRVSRVGGGDNNAGNEKSVSAFSVISGKSGKSAKSTFSRATLFNPMLETASAKIIDSLREQLDASSKKIKDSEEEIGRLKSSLVAREQELSRSNRLIGNAAARSLLGDGATTAQQGNATTSQIMSSPIDPQVVDASNKRIIDQLNSQVDFLNEQLAFREAQLANLQGHLQESEVLKTDLAVR
jgi:multidrug resistance efflux pump